METSHSIPIHMKLGTGRERLSGTGAMEEIQLLSEILTKTEKEGEIFSCFSPPPYFSISAFHWFIMLGSQLASKCEICDSLTYRERQKRARNGTESEQANNGHGNVWK